MPKDASKQTMIDAMQGVFLPWFGGKLKTWRPWMVFLRALTGLPINDPEDLALYRACTGRDNPTGKPVQRAILAASRRSGKSTIVSALSVFLSLSMGATWKKQVRKGEIPRIFCLAPTLGQSEIVHSMASGLLHSTPELARTIKKETSGSILLTNGIEIETKASTTTSLFGFCTGALIVDECAHLTDAMGVHNAEEILRTLRPSLLTLSGSMEILLSSPHSMSGYFFSEFQKAWGSEDTLCWRGASSLMNPTLSSTAIEEARVRDPEAWVADYGGEFRRDLSSFIDIEALRNCIIDGRGDLPYSRDRKWWASVDMSSGKNDSSALAIATVTESGKIAIACVREIRAPHNVTDAVETFGEVLRSYKIEKVFSDRYAPGFIEDAFRTVGSRVVPSAFSASDAALESLPLLLAGNVELPNNERLIRQIVSLERRTRQGLTRDQVIHPNAGHDDISCAVFSAISNRGIIRPPGAFEVIWA